TVHPLQLTYRGNDDAFVVKLGEPAPIPSLSSLMPYRTITNGPAFTLMMTGTNFVPGAVVQWNSASRATTFMSRPPRTAASLTADFAQVGTVAVTVENPPPGGGSSNALTFTVTSLDSRPVTNPDTSPVPTPDSSPVAHVDSSSGGGCTAES